MKRMLICCSMLCVSLAFFCVTALAEDIQVKIEPVNEQVVQVTQKTGGAEQAFTVTKNSGVESGQLYLVLILKGDSATEKPKPTKENTYYFNVEEATGSPFTTDAYPNENMAKTKGTSVVYLSDYSETGKGMPQGVATITLSDATQPEGDTGNSDSGNSDAGNSDSGNSDTGNSDGGNSDTGAAQRYLGDIDKDDDITIQDVMSLLTMVLDKEKPTGDDFTVADIDGDKDITIQDVMSLLTMVLDKAPKQPI